MKLVYMAEETTPTVAIEGNICAIAYMELLDDGSHDDFGRLFAAAPELLEASKATEQCIQDLLDLWQSPGGVSMITMEQAVKSLKNDALRLTRIALIKSQKGE